MPTPLVQQSLHELLTDTLRETIAAGELQPGEKVPEQKLCARFAISRTPLREALKVLAAEGMLELLPRRGAIVARISAEEIDELFPIMAMYESLAGELLCARASDADIAGMQELHDRMMEQYRQGDQAAYLASNRAFHERLFEIAGNAALRNLYGQILRRIRLFRFAVRKSDEDWRRAAEDHERIIAALVARDAERLPALLREHVTGITTQIAREHLAARG
jgi:DNA-binding GntR family transcriptional regulator